MKNKKFLLLVTVLILLSLLLIACGAKKEANLPFTTGKFINSEHPDHGLVFNGDGTFSSVMGSETLATGTYTVNGDIFIEEANLYFRCPAMSYEYRFDGTNLAFNYVEDPADDPCGTHRRPAFDNVTYTLSK